MPPTKDLALIVLGSTTTAKPGTNRRANQKAHRFENLIDMGTMLKLRDPKFSQVSKKSLLATSARAIGLELPDQPTLYRMVALLAWCDNKQYTQTEVYDHMDDTQKFIKSVPRKKSSHTLLITLLLQCCFQRRSKSLHFHQASFLWMSTSPSSPLCWATTRCEDENQTPRSKNYQTG